MRRCVTQIQMPLEARQPFPSHSGRAVAPPAAKVPLSSLGRSALETSGAQALSQAPRWEAWASIHAVTLC